MDFALQEVFWPSWEIDQALEVRQPVDSRCDNKLSSSRQPGKIIESDSWQNSSPRFVLLLI